MDPEFVQGPLGYVGTKRLNDRSVHSAHVAPSELTDFRVRFMPAIIQCMVHHYQTPEHNTRQDAHPSMAYSYNQPRKAYLVWLQKQEAWRPNKLCITELTKLLTYHVRSGGKKRPSVECHHMASIYFERDNQPSIRWHISDPRQDLGPLRPRWAPGGNEQTSAHLEPKGFHMAFK